MVTAIRKPKDTFVDKILSNFLNTRQWSIIRENWMAYLPTINPPGYPTPDLAAELPAYLTLISKLNKGDKPIYGKVDGFRQLVFWEGVYLLHKCSHILGKAELGAIAGNRTVAATTAYQGSLLGIRAIANFFGAHLAISVTPNCLVDIFPAPETTTASATIITDPDVRILRADDKVGHQEHWALFHKLIRSSKFDFRKNEGVKALINRFEYSDFSRQRNIVNYSSNEWLFPDLFDPINPSNPKVDGDTLSELFKSDNHLKPDSDFSLIVGMIILQIGCWLLKNIAVQTNTLNDEISKLDSGLTAKKHPLLGKLEIDFTV